MRQRARVDSFALLPFVRALAFGSAPERFFAPAFVVAAGCFFEEAARSARFEVPLLALDAAFEALAFDVGFTAFVESDTLEPLPEPAVRSAASSWLRALIDATRARVARDAFAVVPLSSSV